MNEPFKLSRVLEQEHREIDEGLLAFRSGLDEGEWRDEDLTSAAVELRRHIYLEEEFLFPELRASGLDAPVMVMVREHGEIWRALDDIDAARQSGDLDEARLVCGTLLETLSGHNVKEETILYPASDEVLSGDELLKLRAEIERSSLPPGWLCEAVRGR